MTGDDVDDRPLSPLERALLAALADEPRPPAGLAAAVDADLEAVLDAVSALRERSLLVRERFNTCRLTVRGRARLEAVAER
jgi:predicted transcriptional regulator